MNEAAVQNYYLGSYSIPGEKILVIRRTEQLARYAQHLESVQYFGSVWHGLTGVFHGERLIVLAGGIGASQVGDALYALHKPGAACLFAGTCGSLVPEIQIGDYFVAEGAFDGSGYGLTFSRPPFDRVEANQEICHRAQLALTKLGLPNHIGTVFSTGSVVREKDGDFWLHVPRGSQIIEMECAAFLISAVRSNKKAGAFFWITDLPRHGKSFFDVLSERDLALKQSCYDDMIEINLNVLMNI